MECKSCNGTARYCNGGANILTKTYLLYGMGISNKAVREYFISHNVSYQMYQDGDNLEITFEEFLKNIDVIIKSPGIKMDTLLLAEAKKQKIAIISDLELFYLLNPANKYLCVTGTNGKTTVVTYLSLILKQIKIKHFVIGNIGIPCFSIIDQLTATDLLIVEASSYMLESCDKFKPNIFVITNIFPHHLTHHQTYQNYLEAKTSICDNLTKEDIIIYPNNNPLIVNKIKTSLANKYSFSYSASNASGYYLKNTLIFNNSAYYFKAKKAFTKHDQINFLISMMVIISLYNKEYNLGEIIDKIEYLQKPPYRFELVFKNTNLTIYNDSKATNPFASSVSLQEVIYHQKAEKLILICGGQSGGHNYQVLKVLLKKFSLIYLTGQNRYLLKDAWMEEDNENKFLIFENLEDVIRDLQQKLIDLPKALVLFSPMSPSFDQFKSFEERGLVFNELINKYLKESLFI